MNFLVDAQLPYSLKVFNQQLLSLFERNFETILLMFESYAVVEINNSFVIGHKFE
jgi:hypothetical protein